MQPNQLVVGVGASAGGLEAVSELVRHLPEDFSAVLVIAQHLSPSHPSLYAELISRETPLPVQEVAQGVVPEAGVIYVTPPNYNVTLEDGAFHLVTAPSQIPPKPSIDKLFASLAKELGEFAVGVVLSGTGQDGSAGFRTIKAAGGFTIAQKADTAKYSGMPQAAAASGAVDEILPVEAIAEELVSLSRIHAFSGNYQSAEEASHSEMEELLLRVRADCHLDFSGYRESTLMRRLERRMVVCGCRNLTEYLAHIDKAPGEIQLLCNDILISVTAFFRDSEAFYRLEAALKDLLREKRPGSEIRVWVAGCATGEEAYSIAMIIAEHFGDSLRHYDVQVFATDIDERAIEVARAGAYSRASLAEISQERRERFFDQHGERYVVRKFLRDMLVIARHDVTTDPPFPRLDLITCRNLLIYFKKPLQTRVIALFRYALLPNGLLFLGRSESIGESRGEFEPLNERARIFRTKGGAGRRTMVQFQNAAKPPLPKRHRRDDVNPFFELLAEQFAPACVLVDEQLVLLRTFGDANRFLTIPSGEPQMRIDRLVQMPLRNELTALVYHAKKKQSSVLGRPHRLDGMRGEQIRLQVIPAGSVRDGGFVVGFLPVEGQREVPEVSDADANLERELAATREHLQTVIEELETSNEELQALNEEVQAANEELQASNEEMEASNEELHATNEELASVNEELVVRSAELARVNAEFESVQNSMEFPLMVLDEAMTITRMNDSSIRVLGLPRSLVGQHVASARLPDFLDDLPNLVRRVQRDRAGTRTSIEAGDRHYDLIISPINDAGGEEQGYVVAMVDNTPLHRARQSVDEHRAQLLDVMNCSDSLYSIKGVDGRYRFVNRAFADYFACEPEQVVDKNDHAWLRHDIAKLFRQRDLETLAGEEPVRSIDEIEIDGRTRVIESVRFALSRGEEGVYALCTEARDVTARRHAEEQLRLAAKVFDRAGEGISITDAQGRILTVNDAFTRVTGYQRDEVVGKDPGMLKSGKHDAKFYQAMWRKIEESGWWQGEVWNKRKDGSLYPEWLTINAVHDEKGKVTNYVGIFSDITVIKDSQRRVEFLATHDELTGLANRGLFDDRLKHALARAARHGGSLCVAFIDLDNFKVINDSLGHAAGDELLVLAADRLRECTRGEDTVSRFGGDEFALLMEDVGTQEALLIVQRVVDLLSAVYRLGAREVYVSASVGVSFYPEDGEDSDALLRNADAAMYQAKNEGKNQFQLFDNELRVMAHQRLAMETGIRIGLEREEFYLVFQPKIDVQRDVMVGAEALLRWNSNTLGRVSPADFIPVAERAGIIHRLGDWVMDQVMAQIALWRESGLEVPNIAINLSPQQFYRGNLAAELAARLADYQLAPNCITVEITEGVLMRRDDETLRALEAIDSMGVRIAIDDFGTGYSSLAYLQSYPIDELKIDKRFVDEIERGGQPIVKAVIQLAKAFGMMVVAEGVEHRGQALLLRNLGCRIMQGYHYHKPLEPDAFAGLLSTRTEVAHGG